MNEEPTGDPVNRREEYEAAIREQDGTRYVLRLYVAGMTPRSTRAIANLKAICEEQVAGRYDLEVIDARDHPDLARSDQVLAVPTLVKQLPSPLRRLIGDLSNTEHVLVGLDLVPKT